MSESSGANTADLADLLWEKQGRPVDRTPQNWLETEYRAHPPGNFQRPNAPENEADLRMRGLGPIAQNDTAPQPAPVPSQPNTLRYLLGAGLIIATGMLFAFARGRR